VKSKDLYPAVFSRHAAAYKERLDGVMSKRESRGRMRALELATARPGMRILDLACGPGTLTRILALRVQPGGSVVGVDLAPGMIELARRSSPPNASFELMDIEHLAFSDASFDAAVCGHGLQFVPDLVQALGEARRVLRPGCVFTASVPQAAIKESVWALIDSVVDRWLPPPPEIVDARATRAAVGDASALESAALKAGFRSAAVEALEEEMVWESAAQLVSMFMDWWDFAYRIEGMDEDSRSTFLAEAVEVVKQRHPGTIKTIGRNLVLCARAG